MSEHVTIERLALAALIGLMAWVTITVQELSISLAVLRETQIRSVSNIEYAAFKHTTESEISSHTRWLTRLSDRINYLEKKPDETDPD